MIRYTSNAIYVLCNQDGGGVGGGKCLWFMTWEEVQKPPIIDYIINKCFFEKV